jgi:hypothetical protein
MNWSVEHVNGRCKCRTSGKTDFGKINDTQAEAADSIKLRKYKWLFINVCACKNPVTIVTEFRESYQDGLNAPECSGTAFKNNSLVDSFIH